MAQRPYLITNLLYTKVSKKASFIFIKISACHFPALLLRGGNVGRKLDFIAQEMNREANTILSKANDITVSNMAIDLKTEIEKIREQVQNIE